MHPILLGVVVILLLNLHLLLSWLLLLVLVLSPPPLAPFLHVSHPHRQTLDPQAQLARCESVLKVKAPALNHVSFQCMLSD
jgi:hypothetical protein